MTAQLFLTVRYSLWKTHLPVKSYFGCILLLFAIGTSICARELEDGEKLLLRVIARYDAAQTYTDRGRSITVFPSGKRREIPFSTFFVAPKRFRLEWVDTVPVINNDKVSMGRETNVLSSDGSAICARYGPRVKQYDSVNTALSGANGISGGVAYRVLPWMLLNREPTSYISRIQVKIAETEELNGVATYILLEFLDGELFQRLWVEKERLALRRIERIRKENGNETTKFIEYDEVFFDAPVDESKFVGATLCLKDEPN